MGWGEGLFKHDIADERNVDYKAMTVGVVNRAIDAAERDKSRYCKEAEVVFYIVRLGNLMSCVTSTTNSFKVQFIV